MQLRAVTRENFEAVTDLELLAHQRRYLASNSYSLAQASFYPELRPRAIYRGDALIGFAMYAAPEPDDNSGEYAIWRFMVDVRHQGRGHGRHALQLLLDEIRSRPDATKIYISYKPDNPVARGFYASFGFVETGMDESGEMVAEIGLPA